MLNFGIIGFGFMGQTHADTIQRLTFASLAAVCDCDINQLANVPTGVASYATAEELVADDKVNTVIISVPNHLHLHMVQLAAAAKKDIILEKPAGLTGDEVTQMIQLAEAANVRFTIHHQRRWDKDYRIVKKIYDTQTLGTVYTIKSSLYGFNGNMHDWHVYPEFGGGMLYDWGVHLIDQLLFMIPSDIETIYANVQNVINQQVDDYFSIQLYFKNGINAHIELGTYMLNDQEKWFEHHWFIGGDKGSANVDGFNPTGAIVRTNQLLESVPGKVAMTPAGPTRSFGPPPAGRLINEALPEVHVNHDMFFQNYYEYVEGKAALIVQPNQIERLMKVVDAIRLSAKEHRSVAFE